MVLSRRDRWWLWVLSAVAVGLFFGLLMVRDERATLGSTEYLLDADGCKAAQRLGVELKIDNGMCAVRAEGDHGQHLFLAGGVRISQTHVLGSRSVK